MGTRRLSLSTKKIRIGKEKIIMMDLRINNGNMRITDDNQTIVSSNIAEEINDNYKTENKDTDNKVPNLVIKD